MVAFSTVSLPLAMWTKAVTTTFDALCLHPTMDADGANPASNTQRLLFPMLAKAPASAVNAPCLLFSMLAKAPTPTVHAHCLPLSMLANPTTAAR